MENTTKLSKQFLQELHLKGVPHKITVEETPFGFSRITTKEGLIKVQIPAYMGESNEDFSKLVHSWFRNQAKMAFHQKVGLLKRNFGFSFNRIVIKDTTSRWGSCSGKGNLNFNWRLIMAPDSVLNYIAVHETAHLEQLNHSPAFWKIVSERCPDYQFHQNWLKKNGANLLYWKLAPLNSKF